SEPLSELPSDLLEPPYSDSVVTVPSQPKPPDPNLLFVVGVIHQTWNPGISVYPRSEESLWEEIMDESPWKQPLRNPTQLKKEKLRKKHVGCSYITITPPPKPPDDESPPTAAGTPLVEIAVVEDSPWLKEFAYLRMGDQGAISAIHKLNTFLIPVGQAQTNLSDWVQEETQWSLYSCLLKLILELTCHTQIKAKEIAKKIFEFVVANFESKTFVSSTRMSTLVQVAIKKGFVPISIRNHSFDILMDIHAARELSKPYVVVSIGVGKSTTLNKIDCCFLQHKIKVIVNACDSFQLGVVKQLLTRALRLQTTMLAKHYEKDHAAVAKESLLGDSNMFLIDTSSHLQNNEPLLSTLSKWVCFNLILISFVGETLVYKDAVDQHSPVSIEFKRWQTIDFGFFPIDEEMVNELVIKVKYYCTYMLYCPYHCSYYFLCNNGVECLDHWCPWVSKCMESKNIRGIFLFVSSATILCTYMCSTSIFYIKVLRYGYCMVRKAMKESGAT
ncbi:signal recognition particle receptor subunit alpha-like, partial [Trifolium medium]|nr:signal recognition particle receptor subunit alpha-like [Trifolium medium]